MTRFAGSTLRLTPAGLQSRYRSSPTGELLAPSRTTHFLSVALPPIVGSVNGLPNRPNAAGRSLFAGVPIAGSVNALTVEAGRSWALLSAGNAAATSAAATGTTPRRAL